MDLKKLSDYFLLFLLVGCTGIPFFKVSYMALLIPCFLVSTAIFIYRGHRIDKFIVFYILAFLIIHFGQMIKFYYLPLSTYIGLYIRILFAYFTLKVLGEKFSSYYVNLIYGLSIISFFIYFPSLVSPGFQNFLISSFSDLFRSPFYEPGPYPYFPDLFIYVFNSGGTNFLRNAGPFWEPGAFAGFLVVALIFHAIENHSITDRKGWILLIALATTVSTTGLVALAFFLISFVITKLKPIYKIILIPLMLGGSVFAFFTFDFLGEKIVSKMDYASAGYNTRFGSAVLDLKDTLKNPVFGLGRNIETRFQGQQSDLMRHRNNGVTNYLVTYGIFIFIFYFYLIYYSFKMMCQKFDYSPIFATYAISLIFIIGFSEGYFTLPFFYALTMMHIVFPLEKENSKPILTTGTVR